MTERHDVTRTTPETSSSANAAAYCECNATASAP